MIPYFPQPVWILGPFPLHAFGVTAAAALLFSYWLVLRRAPGYGIDSTRAGSIFIVILIAALVAGFATAAGGRRGEVSGSGFAVGGIAMLVAAAWHERSWKLLDLIAGTVPLMNAVARTGCFLAHDHIGRPTASWLGVQFPGGNRYDLGLLYALSAAIVAAVTGFPRTSAAPGFTAGLTLALMAITRLIVLRFGSTISVLDESIAGVLFVGGCQIAVARFRVGDLK